MSIYGIIRRKALWRTSIEVPEGIEVRMVENTTDTMHFILPPEPSDELSDDDLEGAAGGTIIVGSHLGMCY